MNVRYPVKSAQRLCASDLDAVAQAFGFHDYAHLERVTTGKQPSALAEASAWEKARKR